ncbi:hypothetical protein VTK73DRAFT_6707 [Phialemonium thermophilum]|uniref:Zn(2)-C6 fungal-type domain-containing protein n=1 Tax=Phialemonium thermophilum TaxID=223376 RepID=A0ABR3XV56_9PEZI
MDQGPPDSKRPRLFTGPSWSGGSFPRSSLLHPPESPTSTQLPYHNPQPPAPYQPSHPFSRPTEHPHPPPPATHRHPNSHAQHHSHPLPPPTAGPPPPPPPPPQSYTPHQSQPPPPYHSQGPPPLPPPPPSHHGPAPPRPPSADHLDDRRYREADRYPAMQDQRQPPPSPAHPVYPGYSPRDNLVKPDPAEDTLPQLRRPHSTGGAPESLPGPPHPVHIPQPPQQEDRKHMSYDGGLQNVPYRQPSYPPPPSIPQTPSYEYPPQYGPPQAEMHFPIPITATSRRKAQRASQACDSCRQLKAKCDETKPCKSCREKKLECKYRDPVPKQQDKIAADTLEGIMMIRTVLTSMERRLRRMERHVFRRDRSPNLGADGPPEGSASSADLSEGASPSSLSEAMTEQVLAHETEPPPIDTFEARKITRQIVDEDDREVEPGVPVAPKKPSIPLNHTTQAALLLKWRSIRNLVQHHLVRENIRYIEEFPLREEQRRGLLRVFGRGEGQDVSRGDKDGLLDPSIADGYSDVGAPSPADCWGAIGSLTPPPSTSAKGVILQNVDLSEAVVWKCVKSYEENIQNMHPLIIPQELYAMVKVFLEGVQALGNTPKTVGIAKFATQQPEVGSKRKRQSSPGLDVGDVAGSSSKPAKPALQRSITNALVLLVIALGKICLCKDKKLPEPVLTNEPSLSSPLARNAQLTSPIQSSRPSISSNSQTSGLPSPKENTSSSRRASFQGGSTASVRTGPSVKRNIDIIPGLGYFALATDIMGAQLAGSTMRHVYAYILAGLYHGQLGRVVESYAYIRQACYAVQVKMRPSLHRFAKLQESSPFSTTVVTEKTDNQLIFAFWSCLQLESDIIAELPLPQSNILAYEELMPLPNLDLAREHGFDTRVLLSYKTQLYLRRKLNDAHQLLYNPEHEDDKTNFEKMILYLEDALDMRFIADDFKFNLDDPPAKDFLSARLRAKYWGARVITFRPFVQRILEFNAKSTQGTGDLHDELDFGDKIAGPTLGPEIRSREDIDDKVLRYAGMGVQALVESTRAFHGLEDKRFVVTNVFGTAHAQWGNLLTLAAVYKDPILCQFVSERLLRSLFAKTIQFFQIISHSSSALAIDMRILQGLNRELWSSRNVEMTDAGPNSSFSSNTSSQGPVTTPIAAIPPPMSVPPPPVGEFLAPALPVHEPT